MPKRTDIHKILLIGSGPIVIGQACEFDYSGTQACKALAEEGYEVVLVNSNPATIMTDPEFAHRTYIEPIVAEALESIIERERPDALLPTLGGQTALNATVELADKGVLKKYGVELIGANVEVIKKAEDRELFKEAMANIHLEVPRSGIVRDLESAKKILAELGGCPVIIRPAFTLGGVGGSIANSEEEFEAKILKGLEYSPISQVLLEESVKGWKEFELEVMRDLADNVVIICSIENFDPMGVHTGDSITVAPAQTLTDRCYQEMRDAAIKVIREIGVETGGSNIQFAVNPQDGRLVVIEMNPRVSRSSALASKATGFPIAKIAAKLAVGYTLDELPNDITRQTPAAFEPTIDYCVVKIPRWAFEKFPEADSELTTQMKSVGEVMAIGRTFRESLQKAVRSLEIGGDGLSDPRNMTFNESEMLAGLRKPNAQRLHQIMMAFQSGWTTEQIFAETAIDPWFLDQLAIICEQELRWRKSAQAGEQWDERTWRKIKSEGFSDPEIARWYGKSELEIRKERLKQKVAPSFKLVDTCAAEFEAYTPYFYSNYDPEDELQAASEGKSVLILGAGPNRIGQGIEFDYCCVHASFAVRELGLTSIMYNSNPETVSTDYDTSDRLYFEPITLEEVLNVVEKEKPRGVIVQLGGQTPLKLAVALQEAGVPILGTPSDAIDRAEDRERFHQLITKLKLRQPESATATSLKQAQEIATQIGYPVLIRPSYVLGGRAMEIVYDDEDLQTFAKTALKVSGKHPILIDKFLEQAIEVDVDAVSDGETVCVAGILEHIEHAGTHSGDAAMVLPPHSLTDSVIKELKRQTRLLALELGVIGLMNIQFAVKQNQVYILEVNPRASRTVPFVSKTTGIPWAKIATKVMLGAKLKDLKAGEISPKHYAVKESVFPFVRFPGVDAVLGPEMRSTGEVMGIDHNFGMAFAKSQFAAGQILPKTGTVFLSVTDSDKAALLPLAKRLTDLGFNLAATKGTAQYLNDKRGLKVTQINKLYEGHPNVVDAIKAGEIHLVINTPSGKQTKKDETKIRSTAVFHGVPLVTTLNAADASVEALEYLSQSSGGIPVCSIQEYHSENLSNAK
ncbi:MAG: carbamoyl-phosphate synthase large subunit [Candidatus Omnitrophica bacterium]|nr:carbamoyl-phosphate synthase large subunit [Candidatus Omnitrophota bacterium]